VYLIHNAPVRDVFMQGLAFRYPHTLNSAIMCQAAELFKGTHDFSAYCKAESLEVTKQKKRGTVRTVYDVQVTSADCRLSIAINGDGFLHNMVRIIAGTLLYVSEGKLSLDNVKESLLGGERKMAGKTLPACGLYLNRVFYGGNNLGT
jgi:tRNA pseudouridine38-40 synthase